MKKLAYIILVIAILVVISHFVKQRGFKQPETTNETTVVITENATDNETTPAIAENTRLKTMMLLIFRKMLKISSLTKKLPKKMMP